MLKGLFTKGVYPRKWEALIHCFPSTCLILVYFLGGFGHRKAVKHLPQSPQLRAQSEGAWSHTQQHPTDCQLPRST